MSERTPLKELAFLFLKLGTIAFGGPAAHIAMMEDEVIRKRGWLTHDEFLDMLSATNFIPGPNSTELAIHIGYRRAGIKGLVVAGSAFILPAALIVSAIAWAYVCYGALPEVKAVLFGIKPVIIAVITQAIYSLSRSAIKSRALAVVAILSLLANLSGADELLVIALAGLVSFVSLKVKGRAPLLTAPLILTQSFFGGVSVAASSSFSFGKLFLFFLKVGSVLFGSGYVLIAFLRGDLVNQWHWLTETQLLDAIAVGQFTPGPVFTTATFIGYVLGGGTGATLATLGIFLPAFFFVAISAPYVLKLRKSEAFASVLNGVNVASLAVMTGSAVYLARGTFTGWQPAAVALVAFVLLSRYRVNSALLIVGGAIFGMMSV